ncbi:hypothetical protein T03_6054 [Trichinella britovi]|uniref:Uncharacterized protein n=1 Tax=Trichinella britovi TaxID=45882 RepID=A0A0V1CDT7_TRIBR|nr:hypothetical protein T03_6054 [Trichinella britovi]
MIAWHGIFQMLDRVSFCSRRPLFTKEDRRSDKASYGDSGWVPPKTASSGMLLVNPFVSSIGGEAQRVSFVNNGRREQKETRPSIWKTPCQAIMFGVSEKRPSNI